MQEATFMKFTYYLHSVSLLFKRKICFSCSKMHICFERLSVFGDKIKHISVWRKYIFGRWQERRSPYRLQIRLDCFWNRVWPNPLWRFRHSHHHRCHRNHFALKDVAPGSSLTKRVYSGERLKLPSIHGEDIVEILWRYCGERLKLASILCVDIVEILFCIVKILWWKVKITINLVCSPTLDSAWKYFNSFTNTLPCFSTHCHAFQHTAMLFNTLPWSIYSYSFPNNTLPCFSISLQRNPLILMCFQ